MKWLSTIATNVSRTTSLTKLKIKKHSPELLMIAGAAAFVGALVESSKSGVKAQEIFDLHNDEITTFNDAIAAEQEEELVPGWIEDEAPKQKVLIYARTAGRMAKAYWKPLILATVSLSCFGFAFKIEKARYLAAAAAFESISSMFDQYRHRVINEQGELMDRHYLLGTELTEITEKTADGKKQKIIVENTPKENVEKASKIFCKVFGQDNVNWDPNWNFTRQFLEFQEYMCNITLHQRGVVFLNDVYDALGYERTAEGAFLGWSDKDGLGYVDFGLGNLDDAKIRRLVNRTDTDLVLTFHVDGLVYELLQNEKEDVNTVDVDAEVIAY